MGKTKKIPQRQCVGCGQMGSKKEMIRVIRTMEETVELDGTGRKNGRGAYLCKKMDCYLRAAKNKSLERALKLQIPPEIYEKLEKEMSAIGE